jgi:hypothetical protein
MHMSPVADLWPGFHEWTSKCVFSFEDGPDIIMIPHMFEFF